MRPAPKLLVFDLDGTLVDSLPDIASALDRTLAADDLGPLPREAVARMIGDGARTLIERGYRAAGRPIDGAALDQATTRYLADYEASSAVDTSLFPDVAPTLERLASAGFRMAVCTNKPEAPAHDVLRAFGIASFFAAVGGGDSFPVRKPHPRHLLAVIEAAGGEPATAAMIGDHHNDLEAGRGAGVALTVFAAWGYGPPALAAGAGVTAQRFADLPEALEPLRMPEATG